MGKISKIESQKKRQGRFNVFVDGKFAVGLSEKDLIESGISNGQEISEEEILLLKKKNVEGRIKDKALKLLSIRPRSILELKTKLQDKGYDESSIKKTISWLKKEGFLDDKKFTKMWVEGRKNFHPLGKFRLSLELKKKQVPLKIIEKEVSKIPEKEEVKDAKDLAKRRAKLYLKEDKYKKRQKVIAFLTRRGYSWSVISKAIEKI